MHCQHCGTHVRDDARFCFSCGKTLPEPVEATTPMPAIDELQLMLQAETAGTYEIVRELGRGGMGAVYLAIETSLGREVAIKVLPPEFALSADSAERFRRESRTAAALDHPNIIPVYRVSERGRLLWFAMKFLQGKGLDERIRSQGHLSLGDALAIFDQLADALDFAHSHGVVHRDFKPQNVILDRRDRAVVTDFGLAKVRESTALTATGGVLGTPAYMAPEQWLGGAVSGATDQYAAAIVMCEMLSGGHPFTGDSFGALMQGHVSMDPPLPRLLRDQPPGIRAAIARALSKDPAKRYPSVSALLEEMRAASAEPLVASSPQRAQAHARETPAAEPPPKLTPWEAAQARGAEQPQAPPAGGRPLTPWEAAHTAAGSRPAPPKAGDDGTKRNTPMVAIALGGVIVVLIVYIAGQLFQSGTSIAAPTPAPAASPVSPPVAPAPPAAAPIGPRSQPSMAGAFSQAALDHPARVRSGSCAEPDTRFVTSEARQQGGEVQVRFVVDKSGRPERRNMLIVSSTNHQLDGSAINALTQCRFDPGSMAGFQVRSIVTMPVTFVRQP